MRWAPPAMLLLTVGFCRWLPPACPGAAVAGEASRVVRGQAARPGVRVPAAAPELPEVISAIDRAVGYLVANCDARGRFRYLRHPDGREYPADKYNLLRHAGTTYGLVLAHGYKPTQRVRDTVARACSYLRGHLGPVADAPSCLALWSPVKGRMTATKPARGRVAKLGGSGLALVCLASARPLLDRPELLAQLRGLGRFIRFMQQPTGAFHSKYYEGVGMERGWSSLYYPGEAMLGLVLLYEADHDRAWLRAALRGMLWLERGRRGRAPPADHWALLATARMLVHARSLEEMHPGSVQRLRAHARAIVEVMLAEQNLSLLPACLYGSFLHDGRICPAAIRLEGLLAMRPLLAYGGGLRRRRVDFAVEQGVAFLLRSQIRGGSLDGGFPRNAMPPPGGLAVGVDRRAEVRIDYVQHALCALLAYARSLPADARAPGRSGVAEESR